MMHYCVNIDRCALSGGVVSYLGIDWPAAAPTCWEQRRRPQLKPFPRKQVPPSFAGEDRWHHRRRGKRKKRCLRDLFKNTLNLQARFSCRLTFFFFFVSLVSIVGDCLCFALASQRLAGRRRVAWLKKKGKKKSSDWLIVKQRQRNRRWDQQQQTRECVVMRKQIVSSAGVLNYFWTERKKKNKVKAAF